MLEGGGETLGEFDGLRFDGYVAEPDVVGADAAAGGGSIAVGDAPGGAWEACEGAGAEGVEDCVGARTGALDARGELSGPDLLVWSAGDYWDRELGGKGGGTQRSAEPVSMFRLRTWGGVPMLTGVR